MVSPCAIARAASLWPTAISQSMRQGPPSSVTESPARSTRIATATLSCGASRNNPSEFSILVVRGDGIHAGDSLKVILDSSLPPATATLTAPVPLRGVSFDGDSKSDILWQSNNGTVAAWLMDGTTATTVTAAGSFNPGPTWHVKGSGDFDGDGKADIIWQGDNGTAAMWLMDGPNTTFVGAVGPFNPGSDWHVII